jgi:S1-C subfamily serine protease
VPAILVGVEGTAPGWRLALQPGTWLLRLEAGRLMLAPAAPDAVGPRLQVGHQTVALAPGSELALRLNNRALDQPARLESGDLLAIGPLVLRLDLSAGARGLAEAADAVAVALPPPDPPRWRSLVWLAGVVLVAAVVAVVVRVVPERRAQPLKLMAAEARSAVQRSTVWIRATDIGSEGSGFVASENWVITNAHVVKDAKSVQVVFGSGGSSARSVPATVVRVGEPATERDIALLQVPTGDTPALLLANLAKLSPGAPLAAFGYPLGSELSLNNQGPEISIRTGSLTALRRESGRVHWVESDIPAEVGNSGGPVVTLDGRVAGLATMLIGLNLRVALAVSAEMIRDFAPEAVRVAP